MLGFPGSVWVIGGLIVLCTLFFISALVRLYRKAGPHEALVVYGFRGTRVVKGGGTVVLPLDGRMPLPFARTDVVRRRSATGPLYETGSRGHR